MSQTLLNDPTIKSLNNYLGLSEVSDDGLSDASSNGSPISIVMLGNDGKEKVQCHSHNSGKSSCGVSESSFNSPPPSPIETVKTKMPLRRQPAIITSLDETLSLFVVDEFGSHNMENEFEQSDDDELVIARSDEERKKRKMDDQGFVDFSPSKKREILELKDEWLAGCLERVAKRARLDVKEITEEKVDRAIIPLLVDESDDDVEKIIILPKACSEMEEVVASVSEQESFVVCKGIVEDDSFQVGGVEWNFSARTAEYLTSSEFVIDIFNVILDRENGDEVFSCSLSQDVNEGMRLSLVERILQQRKSMGISLTTVHLCLRLVDLFLSSHSCSSSLFPDVGIVCFVLASKMEEYECAKLSRVSRCLFPQRDVYEKTLAALEKSIYSLLNFDIDLPTSFIVANLLHTVVVSTKQQVHLCNYLLELSLFDLSMSQLRPSVVAVASVAISHGIARETVGRGSLRYLSDIESLSCVERRLSHFTGWNASMWRQPMIILTQLFEKASSVCPAVYDEYGTEDELYVSFFEISAPLKKAMREE